MKSALAGATSDAGGPARQLDVAHRRFGGGVPQASCAPGWPVSAWKVSGVTNCCAPSVITTRTFGAGVLQAPRQVGGLVGGDAAGDAQQDPLPGQAAHRRMSPARMRA